MELVSIALLFSGYPDFFVFAFVVALIFFSFPVSFLYLLIFHDIISYYWFQIIFKTIKYS